MRTFHTGMIAHGYPVPKGFPYRGKGWILRAVDFDPEDQYRRYQASAPPELYRETRCPKEIVVIAQTESAARRAHDLLWSALTLVLAGQIFIDFDEIEDMLIEKKDLRRHDSESNRNFLRTSGVQKACELAAKVSFRHSRIYALAKYQLSTSLWSAHLVDLDPYFATEELPRIHRPLHSMHATSALVLAYGAIEELGLEVRASNKQPSQLNGSWNPTVKQDLEARLTKAGINIHEQINWQIRGQRTKLETEKPKQIHQTAKKSPWSRWSVRDRMVDIVDAIAHLSWLRSSISSHRTKVTMVRLLTTYDVTNGQFLARRLILESLGMFKM